MVHAVGVQSVTEKYPETLYNVGVHSTRMTFPKAPTNMWPVKSR